MKRVQLKTRTLTRRILYIVLVAQLSCALALCGAALLHERHMRFLALDARLQGSSDSLLGAIQDAEDPEDNVKIDATELQLPKEDVYAVYNYNGRLLGASHEAPSALIQRGQDAFRNVNANGYRYRLLQREGLRIIDRLENSGIGLRRPVTILYATPERPEWLEIITAARFYLFAIAFATLLTALQVALLLKKTLQPLADLAHAAESLSPPSLSFQPPSSVMRVTELLPLAAVLSTAVERLKESFEKEQRFVSDAAHELKTSIAVVRSSIQVLMLKQRSTDEYEEGLQRILQDNQRVELLIAQMLQLARMEQPAVTPLPPRDFNLAVTEAVGKLASIAEDHQVRIQLEQSPGLRVAIASDAAEILVSNLVLNALQHSTPQSSVIVRTSVQQSTVHLEIINNGSGIASEALPHVFERFYRQDSSRSRHTGGSGLGLAICKSIVTAADGQIGIESTPGSRTRAWVTFSLA